MDHRKADLDTLRIELGLSSTAFWWRYFALGGMSTELEVDAILHGALLPTIADCDLFAVVLNERFSELGRDHVLPYSTDKEG